MWKFTVSLSLILALFACVSGPALAQDTTSPPVRPSFDCTKTGEIESLICHDEELSEDDKIMSQLYAQVHFNALGNGPSNELALQRLWLKKRDAECSGEAWKKAYSKGQRACVLARYQSRLNDLAVAALFTAPDMALAELKRQSPADAPVYEAIYRFVTIEDPAIKAKTVERLIEPIYASLDANARSGFATLEVPTAESAVASDESFGKFIDGTAMFTEHHVTWPCASLVRRPGLIAALGAQWGGSIDGAVPISDCGATMPNVSALWSLLSAADDIQPTCDGTIRFSTWRDIAMLGIAVQLHRSEYWRQAKPDAPAPAERAFRSKNSTAIATAKKVLADHYKGVFNIESMEAQQDASDATDLLINHTFTFCGGGR